MVLMHSLQRKKKNGSARYAEVSNAVIMACVFLVRLIYFQAIKSIKGVNN